MANKLVDIRTAAESIQDGNIVGFGGFGVTRSAIAMAHELIRVGRKDLTASVQIAGLEVELLAGAGALKKIIYSAGSLDRFGLLSTMNRLIYDEKIETEEYSGLSMLLRYWAGAIGVSYAPCNSLLGTDVLKFLLEKYPDNVKVANCPFTGEKQVLLRALKPDVAIVGVNYCDEEGSAVIFGPTWDNKEMLHASKRVIVVTEKIVSKEYLSRQPELTTIPGAIVDMVVEVPFFAYPTALFRNYDYDAAHLAMYAKAAKSEETMKAYIDEYILGVKDHFEYLDKFGSRSTLARIARPDKGY